MAAEVDQTLLLGLFGAGVTIISGICAHLYKRTGEVAKYAHDELEAHKVEARGAITEGRTDRLEIWKRIEVLQRELSDSQIRIADRLGSIATREDLRRDIAGLEQRLQGAVGMGSPPVGARGGIR